MGIMKENFKLIVLVFCIWGGLSGCDQEKKATLANPASQNCINKGGKLLMLQRCDLGEYGVCIFPNNFQCEEWALFRGECPSGGVDLSSFLTMEGRYCALIGGKALENETLCQLPLGKTCPAKALYEGKCS
jgi:putative hemolysin